MVYFLSSTIHPPRRFATGHIGRGVVGTFCCFSAMVYPTSDRLNNFFTHFASTIGNGRRIVTTTFRIRYSFPVISSGSEASIRTVQDCKDGGSNIKVKRRSEATCAWQVNNKANKHNGRRPVDLVDIRMYTISNYPSAGREEAIPFRGNGFIRNVENVLRVLIIASRLGCTSFFRTVSSKLGFVRNFFRFF